LIGRQKPTGCTRSPGILRYPDERFILSSLHSRHLLLGVRAIFELPLPPSPSLSLSLSLSLPPPLFLSIFLSLSLPLSVLLSLYVSVRVSLSAILPLGLPSWSSAVHSGKQGSTSVPRWFSVHTRIYR